MCVPEQSNFNVELMLAGLPVVHKVQLSDFAPTEWRSICYTAFASHQRCWHCVAESNPFNYTRMTAIAVALWNLA